MIDGLLVVDKPAGPTSHDVVARCRRALGQRRVGHAGTLDPDATGVLLVGLGRATRLLRFVAGLPKRYEGELVLGVATSTLDAAGEVTGTWDMSRIGPEEVQRAAAGLTGEIQQVPPMVSAVKVGGRRLHQLARAGAEVERPPRPVTVYRFDVSPAGEPGVYRFDVECSSGTYVRVLAADLGAALGGGGHVRTLRRTSIGPFGADAAVPLDEVSPEAVLPADRAVASLPVIAVAADQVGAVRHGRRLPATAHDGPVAVTAPDGRLLAVYEPGGGQLRAAVVLDPA